MATLDHLMVAHRDLDTAIGLLQEATGVRAAPGGRHPGQGTHNALASFGDGTYLELIAPDPDGQGPLGEQFSSLDDLTIATWIARADTAEEVVTRAESAGWAARIMPLSRATPDGGLLEWRMVSIDGHRGGGVMPLFIDWGGTPHPSTTQPTGLTLASFTVSAPAPQAVKDTFAVMGLDIDVEQGEESYRARITGPDGSIDLQGQPMVRVG